MGYGCERKAAASAWHFTNAGLSRTCKQAHSQKANRITVHNNYHSNPQINSSEKNEKKHKKKKIPQNLFFFSPQPTLHAINLLYVATTQRNFNGSLGTARSKVWRFWMVVLKKPEASPFPTPGTRLFTICFNTFTMSVWLLASEFTE